MKLLLSAHFCAHIPLAPSLCRLRLLSPPYLVDSRPVLAPLNMSPPPYDQATPRRLLALSGAPQVQLDGGNADPLAAGLAQVCDPAQRQLETLLRGASAKEDQQLVDGYRKRRGVLTEWRKKLMKGRDVIPQESQSVDLLKENLQAVADRIWATSVDELLELVCVSAVGMREVVD